MNSRSTAKILGRKVQRDKKLSDYFLNNLCRRILIIVTA